MMDTSKTAPAAVSFIILMSGWYSSEIKSAIFSMEELTISKPSTKAMQTSSNAHSCGEIEK